MLHGAVLGDAMTDTAEIRRHLAAMTPGRWYVRDRETDPVRTHVEECAPVSEFRFAIGVPCPPFAFGKLGMLVSTAYADGEGNAAGSVYLHNNAEAMADEIDALRAAMKRLRENIPLTLRRFAIAAGVSPTQMSEWTSDPIATPPDLVD